MERAREPSRQRAAGLGLAKGDRVALLAYNCVEWMEIYVALAQAGLVAVPINFRLVAAEIEYIATNCEARAFIVQDDLVDRIEPIRDQLGIAPSGCIHFGDAPPAGWRATRRSSTRAPTEPGVRSRPRTRGR